MIAANSPNPNTIQINEQSYFPLPDDPDLLTLADVMPMISDLDALREIVLPKVER